MLISLSAIGFILGLFFLSKAGGPWIDISRDEDAKKIEEYWIQTGLGAQELTRLVSNIKCQSSKKYYLACLNAVIEGSLHFKRKISLQGGHLSRLKNTEFLDEKSEKDLLNFYASKIEHIDFSSILAELVDLEVESKRPRLYAQLINSFLSVYADPHTYILPEKFYDEVGSKIKRSKYFVGIAYEKMNGIFYIRKIFKNSDAESSGLLMNDKILSLNSVDLKNAQNNDLSQFLTDETSPVLKFKIERNNNIIDIEVKRSYKQLSHVQFNRYHSAVNGKNFGLLTLTKFNSDTCSVVADQLNRIKRDKLSGLVLDLRDNPGGQLDEASCIVGLFLGKNKVAYSVEYFSDLKQDEVVLTSQEKRYGGPLVVLVNGSSASASELVAGALQEYGRALIVGERTYGKGTFQEPELWDLNPKVKLFKTQGLYLLPSGNSTQLVGVKPDIELPPAYETKREEQIYFNPILIQPEKYHRPKKAIQKVFVYNPCQQVDQIKHVDYYLQEGLNYLSCVKSKNLSAVGLVETSPR